jgi:hypothetical protein
MPRISSETKQKRKELVSHTLQSHPNGLTEKEIADMLNMGRRTVHNYLHELRCPHARGGGPNFLPVGEIRHIRCPHTRGGTVDRPVFSILRISKLTDQRVG